MTDKLRFDIPSWILITVIGLLGILFALWSALTRPMEGEKALIDCALRLESELEQSQREMEEELYSFDLIDLEDFMPHFLKERKRYEEAGHSFFIFSEGDLVAWSDHHVPEAEELDALAASGPALLLGNAWYIIRERQYRDFTAYGLQLVKYEYDYQNSYLKRDFHPRFELQGTPSISATPSGPALPVRDGYGTVLFYVEPGLVDSATPMDEFIGIVLLLLLLHVLALTLFEVLPFDHPLWSWSVMSVTLLGLRALLLYFDVLGDWIGGGSTSTFLYASSSLNPSLADLVINAFLILEILWWLRRALRGMTWPLWMTALGLSLFMFGVHTAIDIIAGLVEHGQIALELDGQSGFGVYSVLAYFGVAAIILSVFLAARIVWSGQLSTMEMTPRSLGIRALVWVCIALVALWVLDGPVHRSVFWATFLLMMAWAIIRWKDSRSSVALHILILAAMAVFGTQTLESRIGHRERVRLKAVGQHLLEGYNADAELRVEDLEERLSTDTLLWRLLDRPDIQADRIVEELREGYFDGFFNIYELRVDILEPQEPFPAGYTLDPSDSSEVSLLDPAGLELGLSYAMAVRPEYTKNKAIVEFVLRIIPEELGFPELLVREESPIEKDLRKYSIARYIDAHLVDSYGDFIYPYRVPSWLGVAGTGDNSFEQEGHWHYPFARTLETYVLSIPQKGYLQKLSTFTLLFLSLALLIVTGRVIFFLLSGAELPRRGLQGRIQTLVVGMLTAAVLIFGLSAYAYITQQKNRNVEQQLEEKAESVLIELSQKVKKENALADADQLQAYLMKFSKVFFTDIALFDLDGRLLSTSRPELFSRGLLAPIMPSEAYLKLAEDRESLHISEERIGELEYRSAYVPFSMANGQVDAYLNLPYFARQGELQSELATFLIAALNLLVVLFLFSVLLAVTVSSWITRPLQLLREHLADMRLGAPNRPIPYQGGDEIAALVQEYNAKVAELQENADRLAQSERESAWREMAKQVAHEIKNPLTPMKLSLQYLQRTAGDGGADWEERFERSTKMLIEQIDTLSSIATAFSDFAKMPKADKSDFDLYPVLHHVVELFSESNDVLLLFRSELSRPQYIHADRDQLTRLFTNLVKNAIQSIPDDEEGKVEVMFDRQGANYLVEVRDNGSGIPEEMRQKIFQPNFTTKTTGTGLGLAMCKNIVASAGGSIWFETKAGKGTSFYVSLPARD